MKRRTLFQSIAGVLAAPFVPVPAVKATRLVGPVGKVGPIGSIGCRGPDGLTEDKFRDMLMDIWSYPTTSVPQFCASTNLFNRIKG